MAQDKSRQDIESSVKSLEEQVQSLITVLGHFAEGLDKVSRVQANQTKIIDGLIKANKTQTRVLKENSLQVKKLLESYNRQNELFQSLVDKDNE